VGVPFQITIECADADRMAAFWAVALGYEFEAPPLGYLSWNDFLRANQLGLSHGGSLRAIVDPTGRGPRVLFVRPGTRPAPAKLHLDVRTLSEDARRAKVDDLLAAGGNKLRRVDERGDWWMVMSDPEGNEFCVT
jgi:catechol 2,3-dioxygenase-like lactoylglutathione lyase family enzyme